MTKFFWSAAVGAAVFAATVVTPATGHAQFDPLPPAPPQPVIIDNTYGPGVGNVMFDRWVDNRRASQPTVLGFSRGPSGRIVRPQPVATLMFRAGQVLPWRR